MKIDLTFIAHPKQPTPNGPYGPYRKIASDRFPVCYLTMTAGLSTYRYRLAWPFLLASICLFVMAFWTYQEAGIPAALLVLCAAAGMLIGYLDWKTFSVSVNTGAIRCKSHFQERLVPFVDIASVDQVFGKSSDFIVIRLKRGASLKIWNYLDDFERFKSLVSDSARLAGIEIRMRDKWGKWKTVPALS